MLKSRTYRKSQVCDIARLQPPNVMEPKTGIIYNDQNKRAAGWNKKVNYVFLCEIQTLWESQTRTCFCRILYFLNWTLSTHVTEQGRTWKDARISTTTLEKQFF